jgi:hypothetical protein
MKQICLFFFLLTGSLWAEIDSAAKEWDFATAQKKPTILYSSPSLVAPGMPLFTPGGIYFTDCSATGRAPCQDIYRVSATDTQAQKVVEAKQVQRLLSHGANVIAQLANDTALYLLQGNSLVLWKADERKQAEAAARFQLHALASADTALPASLYQHPLQNPSLSPTADGYGFQIFSADLKTPLFLGFLPFNAKTPISLMPFASQAGALVTPSTNQLYLSTQNVAADGSAFETLTQVSLKTKSALSIGSDPAGKTEPLEEMTHAQWRVRSISQLTSTPHGGVLVVSSSLEPGERGGVWYFPSENSADSGKVRAVKGVAESDISGAQVTQHGLLVTHGTDRTIALYPVAGAFETPALAPWKKKAEALTKSWNLVSKEPCGAFAVIKRGELLEIRFRDFSAEGVPSYRSLLSYKPFGPGGSWVCDPKQGPAFLTTSIGLNLRQDALRVALDSASLYGTNVPELAKLTARKGDYGAAGSEPRFTSQAARFAWENPVLFQLRGRSLTLARIPLTGTQFASLATGRDEIEIRLQTIGPSPVPFEDYMHVISHGSADFVPVNYTPPVSQEPKQ